MKVQVIGAGIAGLTAALQLHQIGIEVDVFESAPKLNELGVGINLQPPAVKVLAELGLFEQLMSTSVVPSQLAFYSKDGTLVYSELRGKQAGYQYPQLSIHRGKLQSILLDAFKAQVGTNKLHCGHRFESFKEVENSVTANFVDPKTLQPLSPFTSDVLIGADGIGSAVRKQLHPIEQGMHFEGIRMWRGTTMMKPPLDGKTGVICGNPKVQLIVYAISNVNEKGLALVNWVVEVLDPNAKTLHSDLWDHHGSIDNFISYFDDWSLGFLDVKAMFQNANQPILEYPMVDREPLDVWGNDRVTLIGDAAHPMYPRGGNGASQGVIDASVLANRLATDAGDSALANYERERIPLTSRVVLNNRRANQTEIFNLIEQHCDGNCQNQHACVSQEIFQNITESYRQEGGFAVSQDG